MKKESVEQLITDYPKISLKRICEELSLCYQYVLKASKQPIPNQPYNPEAFNFSAVQKIIDKKEVNLNGVDWDEVEQSIKVIAPVNKIEDFDLGTEFTLRRSEDHYTVIFTNETHIVFLSTDPENTQPRVMNWETFLHQSPRIVAHD